MRIELSQTVNRPIDDVFTFLAEPENHPLWVESVLSDSEQSEGAVHEGTTFHEEVKLLGRKFGGTWTVTKYEPPRAYEQQARLGPAHMRIAFALSEVDGATRIDQVTEGESAGFFKIGESVLARLIRNQQQTDLDNLKLLLESQSEEALGES